MGAGPIPTETDWSYRGNCGACECCFRPDMLWGALSPASAVHLGGTRRFSLLVLPWEPLPAGCLHLHPIWHPCCLHPYFGVNVHLCHTFCPHFCELRGSKDLGTGEPINSGLWAPREKGNHALAPHQTENRSPSLYSSKVKFPMGAVKELKVAKNWQFTVPWRGSQKAKWKWNCFYIRPLSVEGRIQTVWICCFTVHSGTPTKLSNFFVKPKQHKKYFLKRTLDRTLFLSLLNCFQGFISFFSFSFYFREGKRGRERGRETSVCRCLLHATHLACHPPGLPPRHVPLLRIKPVTLWFAGWHLIHWDTPARAQGFIS